MGLFLTCCGLLSHLLPLLLRMMSLEIERLPLPLGCWPRQAQACHHQSGWSRHLGSFWIPLGSPSMCDGDWKHRRRLEAQEQLSSCQCWRDLVSAGGTAGPCFAHHVPVDILIIEVPWQKCWSLHSLSSRWQLQGADLLLSRAWTRPGSVLNVFPHPSLLPCALSLPFWRVLLRKDWPPNFV